MSTPAQRLEAERHKYPGMAPREVIIFRAWLALHEKEYDRFAYNVRVGNCIDPGPSYPAIYRQQYIENTQKRIDVLAWKGAQPTIIEVKDRATASCMSQILTYKTLFPITFPNALPPKLLLVTNRVAADMAMVLNETGIQLETVPADFSILASGK